MIPAFVELKLHYFFSLYDQNNKGFLQLDDFTEIADRVGVALNYKPGTKEHDFIMVKSVKLFHRLLKDMPTTDNSKISLKNWLDFFDKELINTKDESVREEYSEMIIGYIFDLFDVNKDGYISREEYLAIFHIFRIDKANMEFAFEKLDVNADGKLSKYELIHGVIAFLTSTDPDFRANWIFGNFARDMSIK